MLEGVDVRVKITTKEVLSTTVSNNPKSLQTISWKTADEHVGNMRALTKDALAQPAGFEGE